MLEFHAWITIRETYKVEEEDNYDGIINEIQKKIKDLKWNSPQLKFLNGEGYIEFSVFSNRKTEEIDELFEFFTFIAKIATGSYGLIYMLDEGDLNGENNEFQVISIYRGILHRKKDYYLSPFIPTVEDRMY